MSDQRKASSRALPFYVGNCNSFVLNALTMLIMQKTLEPSIFCYHSSAHWEL